MATQLCPKCKTDCFTWSYNDEDNGLTSWHCYVCPYTAYEDESLQTTCEKCDNFSKIKLQDESSDYWYCFSCARLDL